jgi:hypothetical protein
LADSEPLIDTDPGEVAVIFTEPTTLTVVPRAVLNREDARKEDWPFSERVEALRKVKEEPRHTRSVEAVREPPLMRAVWVKRDTVEAKVTAVEVEA